MAQIDNGWIILAGTLFGGAGLKVVESWLSRKKIRSDDATVMRGELRDEIAALREQLTRAKVEEQVVEAEVEEWRGKFYDLRDTQIRTQTDLTLANNTIEHLQVDIAVLNQTNERLQRDISLLESKLRGIAPG